jgi:hypothetical protein
MIILLLLIYIIGLSGRFDFVKWFVFVFFVNEFHGTGGGVNYINIYPVSFEARGDLVSPNLAAVLPRSDHEYQAKNCHCTQNKVDYRLTHLHGIPPFYPIRLFSAILFNAIATGIRWHDTAF